jgi:hypothetical protein
MMYIEIMKKLNRILVKEYTFTNNVEIIKFRVHKNKYIEQWPTIEYLYHNAKK